MFPGMLAGHFHFPALFISKGAVHTKEVSSEQRGFITPGSRTNFKVYVSPVIRIFRQQQGVQPLLLCGQSCLEAWQFILCKFADG